MYKCINLTKKNIVYFKLLNKQKNFFNNLNKDFFYIYNKCNFTQQTLLRKKVKLLKFNSNYIGYIWANSNNKYNYLINALNIIDTTNIYHNCNILINSLNKSYTATINCESNNFNFYILKKLNFKILKGTIQLYLILKENYNITSQENINISTLKIGKEEEIRCKLQNEIFKNKNRIPLTIEDIYYDEKQKYYFNEGSLFIKKNNKHIGYGQIIIEDNVPFIVNFGILKQYRGKGYGKILLIQLLEKLKQYNFFEVKLKVDKNNKTALNLYKKLGFIEEFQQCIWRKIKK